jgi:hypothetical protein
MRNSIISFVLMVLSSVLIAQAPQKLSYQAVIRNSSNGLVTSSPVGMRISILQGSATGTPVYVETLTTTTNANGLVSLEIGGGAGFDAINWANDTYFIKTETDPLGGISYTIIGTSQMLSVPYALHAKTVAGYPENDPIFGVWNKSSGISITALQVSDFQTTVTNNTEMLANTAKNSYPVADANKLAAITGTNTGDETATTIKSKLGITTLSGSNTGDQNGSETKVTAGTNVNITGEGSAANPYVVNSTAGGGTRYLGEEYDGGIVYYIYTGSDRLEHGLIVSKTESTATWSGSTLVGANRTEDGAYNTSLMPTGAGTARILVESFGAGWYLPSIDELSLLWQNRYHVNKTARAIGSTLLSRNSTYWSSTEYTATEAYYFHFLSGAVSWYGKGLLPLVRAVRAF